MGLDEVMSKFMNDNVDMPKDNELDEISKLAKEQLSWEEKIIQLETDLDHAKESLKQIQEFLLPEAMMNVGMMEFKMANGSKITIKDDVYASIRKDFINQAVGWLNSVGLGDIVKDQVSVDFGRGESAQELIEFCKKHKLSASEKLSVHPSTLKATVKEMLAKGVEFPDEFFSIAPVKKAIIKSK